MAKARKGKRSEEGQYINMPYAMLKSNAWRSLSGAAVKVWFELHTRYNGSNNGNVRLSLNEAASTLGLGKSTVQRAFNELEEKGFVALTVPGNWYHRRAHEWRLTTKPMQEAKGKISPTHDWRSWTQKTKRDPSQNQKQPSLVSPENPKTYPRSTSEPVTPESGAALGSGLGH